MHVQRVRLVPFGAAVCLALATFTLTLAAQTQGPARITLDQAVGVCLMAVAVALPRRDYACLQRLIWSMSSCRS